MWGNILFDTGRYVECIDVLNQALKHDRTNDILVSALYQTYLCNSQPIRANELLKQYEEALRAAEYDPEEIKDALKEIWDIPIRNQRTGGARDDLDHSRLSPIS